MNFWDTSALVALSVEEPHRQTALRVLEADEHIVVWWGATIEYVAAISRRERDGSLTLEKITMLCSASLSSLRSAGFQPAWRPGWPPSQAGSPPHPLPGRWVPALVFPDARGLARLQLSVKRASRGGGAPRSPQCPVAGVVRSATQPAGQGRGATATARASAQGGGQSATRIRARRFGG